MAKHKLFLSYENSPNLNSSLERSFSGGKTPAPDGEAIRKAGSKKLKVMETNGASSRKNINSPAVCDAVKETDRSVYIQSNSSSIDGDKDSDCSCLNVPGFFSSSNQKFPYTFAEDEEIVKFVLRGEYIFRVTSISLWRELEYRKSNPKRTYQSLKNRFLRNIKPHLFTTFKHLVSNEETTRKILQKFPELKKQVGRKETLPSIKLPERAPYPKVSEAKVSSTSVQENPKKHTRAKAAVQEKQQCEPFQPEPPPSTPSTSGLTKELISRRKVAFKGDLLTVVANLNFKEPPSKSVGIYAKFDELRRRGENDFRMCLACHGTGVREVEESLSSDVESDAFISNSLESKKSAKVSNEKNRSGGQKEKKVSNSIADSFSQSLLNEVDALGELDDNEGQIPEGKNATSQAEEASKSVTVRAEADSTPDNPCPTQDANTDSIYESAIAEFQHLIDSDEEEVLVKKCLKKNLKKLGFECGALVDAANVDSFFVQHSSLEMDSDELAVSNDVESPSGSASPLARNMMSMMKETKE